MRVVDFNLKELFSREKAVDVDVDGVQTVLQFRKSHPDRQANCLFRSTELEGCIGRLLSSNSIGSQPRSRSSIGRRQNLVYTPITSYEDMTRLLNLPKMHLKHDSSSSSGEGWRVCPSPPEEHIGDAGIPGATCGGGGEAG